MKFGVNPALFLYFAYGSDLLQDHFLRSNKGEKIGTGKLLDYGIRFYVPNQIWAGNVLTIVPRKGESVMGVIWNVTSDVTFDIYGFDE